MEYKEYEDCESGGYHSSNEKRRAYCAFDHSPPFLCVDVYRLCRLLMLSI